MKPDTFPSVISGTDLRLRLMDDADVARLRRWRNKPRVRKGFVDSAHISRQQHDEWIAAYFARDDDFLYIMEDEWGAMGAVSLYHVTPQWAELGRMMIGEEDALGKGYASTAVRLLQETAAPRRLYLTVKRDNTQALYLYRACGFIVSAGDDTIYRMEWRYGRPVSSA